MEYITDRHIIKSGFQMEAGDNGGGIIALILPPLLRLCGGLVGLVGLVKLLQMLLIKKTKKAIAQATQLNDYITILVGIGITIVVQSSSVTTSALTPLCGMGNIPLEKMPPPDPGHQEGQEGDRPGNAAERLHLYPRGDRHHDRGAAELGDHLGATPLVAWASSR